MRVAVDWRSASKENYIDFGTKHPNINVSFEICNESGINKLTVSAKNKNYKSSKKLSWGDLIEND